MSEVMEIDEEDEVDDNNDPPTPLQSASIDHVEEQSDINEVDPESVSTANSQNSNIIVAAVDEPLPPVDSVDLNPISNTVSDEDSNSCDASTAKRKHSTEDDDDSQLCPICFDIWTTSGDHRLCALKCGHLFGHSCVKRWLDMEVKKRCPTCNKKVYSTDIRFIYARKVIAMDTTELTIANKKLQKVSEEKNRIQTEFAKATCRIHMLSEELDECKKKLEAMTYMKGTQNYQNQPLYAETVNLYKERTIDLGRDSCCRVFDSKAELEMVGISIKSSNGLYPGYGVKLLNIATYKPTAFVLLHTDAIRDVKFHDAKPWLLSCSVDKKAKLLDINTNRTTITFEGTSPLWSCCWDANYNHNLYVGQQQGSVLKFDIRNPTEPLHTIAVQGDWSPVVSVHSFKSSPVFPLGGVISCKLNSLWAFAHTAEEPLRYPLPVEGPFISMTCHKDNDHLFLSSRPNTNCPYARHSFCGLYKHQDTVTCNIVHTFRGGTTVQSRLSRTCLLSNNSEYAAAYMEDQKNVSLWNVNNGNKVGAVPSQELVLDLNSLKTVRADFLLTLTDSKLRFFKFN